MAAVSWLPGISSRRLESLWFGVLLLGIVWQTIHNYQQNLSFVMASNVTARNAQRSTEARLRRTVASLQRAQRVARMGGWEYQPDGRMRWTLPLVIR